jgi:hypothetical protein
LTQHVGNTSTIWMNAAIMGGRRAPWFSGSIETAFADGESLSDFPEEAFPCSLGQRKEYLRRVELGRHGMRESSAVICGLCRDVRHFLPRMAARIERLGQMFRDYRVVLFENDSIDRTREFLSDWRAANPRVHVMSESLGAPLYPATRNPARAAWLAECRNRYRAHVVSEYAGFDYAIVVDMDLPGGWSFDGVAHTFGHDDWDFVGSFGVRQRLELRSRQPEYLHVDRWAFRPSANQTTSPLDGIMILPPRGQPLMAVDSCFGGLTAYRIQCFRYAEYAGEDCEHVEFHRGLRSAGIGQGFLNPNQIVLYSPI